MQSSWALSRPVNYAETDPTKRAEIDTNAPVTVSYTHLDVYKRQALWIALGIAALVVIWVIATYNGLVKLRNMAREAWSGIDVQLKRRSDLIPNLVETVKGYAGHEKSTLDDVTRARTAVVNAGEGTAERIKAENMLTSTLRSLFAVAEAYPDLKANTNFLQLQGRCV